jgi:hypothetical protein
MYSNQSWPPVISPLGIHPCFRNATRAKQGYCRDWQGHTVFVSIWWAVALSARQVPDGSYPMGRETVLTPVAWEMESGQFSPKSVPT